jgi:hypothetical protein
MSHNKAKVQRDIIDQLREVPFINHTMKKLGVSRMTFYRWIERDEVFSYNVHAALQEGHKNMIEVTESALFKKIRDEHFGAIKFYLENNHGNYMNQKYRVGEIYDRNYKDAPNPAHARIPSILVLDDEQTDQMTKLYELKKTQHFSDEEMKILTDMVKDGTFQQYLEELRLRHQPL